jgi:hypothetical protein
MGAALVLSMLAIVAWAPRAFGQAGGPRLSVASGLVSLEQIPPGSRWVVVGYGRELTTPVTVRGYFQWHVLGDEDRAGKLELDLAEAPAPPLSVWAAFEIDTGRVLTARFAGGEPPGRERLHRGGDRISLADLAATEALLVLLRKKEGAWVWTGTAEVEARNLGEPAALLPRPEDFVPVEESGLPLESYLPQDTFLAIDQTTLELTLTRLDLD